MKRITNSSLTVALLALVALPGCDSQQSTDYQGEPLLRVKGSVAIPQGFEGEELVPVIGFYGATTGVWGEITNQEQPIIDVGVDGDFPSGFTLDVFDPPPAAAMKKEEGGPAFARGYVAAMAPSHPDTIRIREWEPETPTSPPFLRALETCTLDASNCLNRSFECPTNRLNIDDCTLVDSSGDETLAFAGYSQNIAVLYVSEAVEEDSWFSMYYGDGRALPPGYHLFKVRPRTTPWTQAENDCLRDARMTAVDEFNAAHGTSYTSEIFIPAPDGIEVQVLLYRHLRAASCHPLEHIGDPANTPISIQLGTRKPTTDGYL